MGKIDKFISLDDKNIIKKSGEGFKNLGGKMTELKEKKFIKTLIKIGDH